MFYRIVDMKKAIYEIDDLQSAIINVAQTQLKEVFGSMTFTEAMESQELINTHMMTALVLDSDLGVSKWKEWKFHSDPNRELPTMP